MSSSPGEPEMQFVHAQLLPGILASTVGYRSSGLPEAIHRGIPSPYLTFIFSLDDAPIVGAATPAEVTGARAFRNTILVGGLHSVPAYIEQPRRQAGIQMAVHPLAARALFGVPAAELDSMSTDGSDVLGRQASTVRDQLMVAEDWPSAFSVLSGYLRSRLDGQRLSGPRSEIAEAWTWLARHRGTGSMEGLARHVALSRRQLNTLFQREMGQSPKTVSRLMRFETARQHITRAVVAGRSLGLADVAHQHGYYDQSHLVRDFRQFTGLSPSGWIHEERRNIQAGGHQNGEDWTT